MTTNTSPVLVLGEDAHLLLAALRDVVASMGPTPDGASYEIRTTLSAEQGGAFCRALDRLLAEGDAEAESDHPLVVMLRRVMAALAAAEPRTESPGTRPEPRSARGRAPALEGPDTGPRRVGRTPATRATGRSSAPAPLPPADPARGAACL